MSRRDAITKESVEAFLARPWDKLAALKEQHWREALRSDPLATFHASEAMWRMLHESGHTSSPADRDADLKAHRRLRALLDRAGHVTAR